MKKIILIIIILLFICLIGAGLWVIFKPPSPSLYDDTVDIESKITEAINEAKETGEIVLTEEIRTPPYWIPFSINSIAENTGLNPDNICLSAIGEEWPINLKRTDYEVELIAHVPKCFEVVCGQEMEKLKEKVIEKHDFLEIKPELLKIEESCAPAEGECCLLVLLP